MPGCGRLNEIWSIKYSAKYLPHHCFSQLLLFVWVMANVRVMFIIAYHTTNKFDKEEEGKRRRKQRRE